jgi:hypothetical protein
MSSAAAPIFALAVVSARALAAGSIGARQTQRTIGLLTPNRKGENRWTARRSR